MFHRIFLSLLLFLFALATLSCASRSADSRSDSGSAGLSPAPEEVELSDYPVDPYIDEEGPGFGDSGSPPFALSEGQPDWDGGEARPPLAQTTPLTQEPNSKYAEPFAALPSGRGRCREGAPGR